MTKAIPKQVACPVCGKSVPWTEDSRWRPFCSQRCKTIDLGDWAAEQHRIAGGSSEADDQLPSPDDEARH